MMKINGKTFVVTGAGSGMGRTISHEVLRQGGRVVAVDVNPADLAETLALAAGTGGGATAHVVDVTDRSAIERLLVDAKTAHGPIDGLINNAGITNRPTTIDEASYDDFRRIMEVNLWGVVNMTAAFLGELRGRPEACLVNVSSGGGILGFMGLREYCTSKWAVRGYTECLRADLADSKVVVSCVHPGKILTNLSLHTIDLNAEERLEAHRRLTSAKGGITPEAAAKIIVTGIKAGKKRILVGGDVRVMDWIGRLFPVRYTAILHKPMQAMVDSARPASARPQ